MKKTYILELSGRGGEVFQRRLTREGHAIAMQDDSWFEDLINGDFDNHEIFKIGFKETKADDKDIPRRHNDGYTRVTAGIDTHQCNLNIYETIPKNLRKKDKWRMLYKNINPKYVFKIEESFSDDLLGIKLTYEEFDEAFEKRPDRWKNYIKFKGKIHNKNFDSHRSAGAYKNISNDDFEKLSDDKKKLMIPNLSIYSEKASINDGFLYYKIELDEELDLNRISYSLEITNHIDVFTRFNYREPPKPFRIKDKYIYFSLVDSFDWGHEINVHYHIGWQLPYRLYKNSQKMVLNILSSYGNPYE